jgi:hypothetical protein
MEMFSIPWNCGESDCPLGWHLSTYWINDDSDESAEFPYTCDTFSDGDHELATQADYESAWGDYESAWTQYHTDCKHTGTDPLGAINVKHKIDVREKWQFKFTLCIAGIRLIDARRGGIHYDISTMSKEAREFLAPAPGNVLEITRDEFHDVGLKFHDWNTCYIEYKKDRKPSAMIRDIKRQARVILKHRSI